MALDTSLKVSLSAKMTSALDLMNISGDLNPSSWSITLSNGTGAGQSDLVWSDKRQIAASGSEDLDLSGSLPGPLGGTMAFARIKMLAVKALNTNTNNVILGGAAATQWVGPFGAATHTTSIRPGGLFVVGCSDLTGWPVVGGASDFLKVANSGAGTVVDYEIVIIGASA